MNFAMPRENDVKLTMLQCWYNDTIQCWWLSQSLHQTQCQQSRTTLSSNFFRTCHLNTLYLGIYSKFFFIWKMVQSTVKECNHNSAHRSFDLDPTPSKLFIEYLHSIHPLLTDLFNYLLASGIFRQCFKSAFVKPILKMRYLVHNDLSN